MSNPKYLYHGSPNRQILVFKPRRKNFRHPEEGAVVFATDSQAFASKFIVPGDDTWSQLSRFGKDHVAIYSDQDRFRKADKGGAIYKLPSDTFIIDPNFTQSSQEYTSRVPVKVLAKEEFSSGLDAMLKYGVKVYFVNPEQFQAIKKAPDQGWGIIQSLTPITASSKALLKTNELIYSPITIIKIIHSLIWFVMVLAIFYILYAGISGDLNPLLYLAIALLVLEVLVLALNKGSCPLTIVAKNVKPDWQDGDDIFLPKWIAINNKLIFGTLYIIAMLLILYRFLTQ